MSRDRVLAFLWPDSSTPNARHGLEQLLYGLRRQLAASLFLGVDPLRLNPKVLTSDVEEFEEALERGDLGSAISLYSGPFLDGFYLGHLGEFERWAEAERARLAQRYKTALEQLARQATEARDPVAAIKYWRPLVVLDPVSAHATLGLMNALAEADEITEAVRHGRAFEALARIEGAEPTPAISALLRRLLASQSERSAVESVVLAAERSHPGRASDARESRWRRWRVTGSGLAAVTFLLLVVASRYARSNPRVVIASGEAVTDMEAIQTAVDRGGDVALRGHFSLATPATKPIDPLLASGWYPATAEIRISKAVNVYGVRDSRGEMATIESGTVPFYVDAPNERVTIRGLRFVRPIEAAILVRAVRGLEISAIRIDGLIPLVNGAGGISINTRGQMPLPSSPGNPDNVSGTILISDNDIDATGGTAQAPTAGVNILGIGQSPDREVDLDIVSNRISNTTAPAINIRRVRGRTRVLGNSVRTSAETVGDVDAVRLVHAGTILMANNTVQCNWPNAAAIDVFSPFAEWPTTQVTVEDNSVVMSPPAGAALGDFSAGISVRGFAQGIVVRRNTISGRARAALSMYAFRGGAPGDNSFIDNRLEQFQAAVADIFVGSGVARGHIVGKGSLLDHGRGTIRGP